MARVTIQDALDYCLVNPDGLSVEELLMKFPEYRDELQPMLALSVNIATLEPPPVPVDRRAAMKQRLMASASAATLTVAIIPQKSAVPASPPSPPWWESLLALVRRPALVGALGAVAVVALLWWSAIGSLPDSPLYGVKLTSEDALRNLTRGTSGRIDSYLGSASARLNDIREMQRQEKLAQAGPAINNYRSSIASSAALLEQTSGEERTNLAKKLYVSSAQGFVGLAAIAPDLSNIAGDVRANFDETINTLEELRADTGGILISSNVDVYALLLEADIEPSTVPTPLPKFALVTATVTVPAVADATRTSIAATQATETARISAAQLTAQAIIAGSGGPSAGTPSARFNAAQTVVAGGTGSSMASAQQTVLAPVPATETPVPSATETMINSPTATTGVPKTSLPTWTSVVPRATRTVAQTSIPSATRTIQPLTPRPATNTPRPPQATATRRATNTSTLPQPTNIPTVVTRVPTTAVPTSTQVPSATMPVSTFTPVPTLVPSTTEPTPSRTPLPILTQLPPLPTIVLNTPRPSSTPVPPFPTGLPITPLPLPTITSILPTAPALTSIPLPTEILCVLELDDVNISCGLGLCLNSSAVVHNESSSGVSATWTAELRVKVGSGSYITLSTQTGNAEFAPGGTLIEPRFCVPLPIGTTQVQIRLSLSYAGCSEQQSSGAIQPCGLP
ncbi:MAG: DUF5667 domain-containing protein [Chloroflexia bacterium]